MAAPGLHCCPCALSVVLGAGLLSNCGRGRLIAAAPLIAEQGLQAMCKPRKYGDN